MSRERQGIPVPAPPGNQATLLVVVKQPVRIQVSGWGLQTHTTPHLSLPAEPIVLTESREGGIPQKAGVT